MEEVIESSPGGINLFTHRHPVDGKVELRLSEDVVHAFCRWPLDLDANEWATIAGNFDVTDFRRAMHDLKGLRRGRTLSLQKQGFLEFSPISAGTRLELGDDSPPAARLSLILTEPADQLAHRLLGNLDDATAVSASRRAN
jgi:hypothetical protein